MKLPVVLLIDSRGRETAFVGTANAGTLVASKRVPIFGNTHRILSAVRRLAKPGEVAGIVVAVGPGSFTAVRMGSVIANALAFGLGVPIRGVRLPSTVAPSRATLERLARVPQGKRGIVLPVYDRPPTITKRKR